MIDCKRASELIPWYANRTLSAEEARDLARHIATCPSCQEDLVEAIRLSLEVKRAISSIPGAPEGLRERTVPEREIELARFDLGSFLIGLWLGLSVKGTRGAVRGDLRLLGRRVRLFKT